MASFQEIVKGFPKTCDMTSFLSDQKPLVTIRHTPTIKWQSNFFDHHLTHPHHLMVTKKFESPFDGGVVSNCDLKILVTIQ
jgi:hypothetical protein